MAATGAHQELIQLLATDARQATRSGGPFDWDPLLYLCFSRLGTVPDRSAIHTMRALLAAGADPNAGFLWRGMTSPFTALTGVFGGGEGDQPSHPDAVQLARLLLDAGADPNDNQTLYNRGFRLANDHLELLFEYGLGREIASPWRSRLGHNYPSPDEMLTEQLRGAADQGMAERVALLLRQGIDPDGRGYHPIYGDQTPYRLAVLAGRPEIARLLADAGADTSVVDPVDDFLSACIQGDSARVVEMSAADPGLTSRARERKPDTIAKAADLGRVDAVRLLLDLDFDPSRAGQFGRTALHYAALAGNTELVRLLIKHRADPTAIDDHYNSPPAGWAAHGGHLELAGYLDGLTAGHPE
jgi:ankyrin repeat protein